MGMVDGTLGAASIGFFFSCIVFGMLTTQVIVYFQRFPRDRLAYKVLVASLWLLELADQVFIGYSIYYYTITNFGNPKVFASGDVIFTLILQIIMNNLVGTIVKCCFAMRVWRFSKKNVVITGTIVALIWGEFGLAIVYAVRAFQLSVFDGHKLRVIASLALAGGLLTDVIIAASLCYFLRKLRTGFRKADSLVNQLTIYAVNTGALTGCLSLLTLILYNCIPDTFAYMSTYFTIGKLYAISFLATLNTRKVLRGKGTDTQHQSDNTSNTNNPRNTFFMVTNSNRAARDMGFSTRAKSLEIDIHQEVSVIGDVESAAQDVSMVLPQKM